MHITTSIILCQQPRISSWISTVFAGHSLVGPASRRAWTPPLLLRVGPDAKVSERVYKSRYRRQGSGVVCRPYATTSLASARQRSRLGYICRGEFDGLCRLSAVLL